MFSRAVSLRLCHALLDISLILFSLRRRCGFRHVLPRRQLPSQRRNSALCAARHGRLPLRVGYRFMPPLCYVYIDII